MVGSLLQILLGATGIIGVLIRYISPTVVAVTIALIGISLFEIASQYSSDNWWMAFFVMFLFILFSQYLKNIQVPCCSFSRRDGCSRTSFPLFAIFPVSARFDKQALINILQHRLFLLFPSPGFSASF